MSKGLYTQEELCQLLLLVERCFDWKAFNTIESGIHKLSIDILSESFSHNTLKLKLNKKIDENSNIGKSSELMKALFDLRIVLFGSVEKAPLYMNSIKPLCTIAKWRLQIGK